MNMHAPARLHPLRWLRTAHSALASFGDGGALVLLLVASETAYLVLKNPAFLPSLGPLACLLALGSYLALWMIVACLPRAHVGSSTDLRRAALLAALLYACTSAKMLVLDASFLHHLLPLAGYVLVSVLGFVIARWWALRLRDRSVFVLIVLVHFHVCKLVSYTWAARARAYTDLLRDPVSLAAVLAGITVLLGGSLVFARHRRVHTWASACALVALGLLVAVRTETHVNASATARSDAPDILVFSVDALRKDVFDRHCARTTSPAMARVCASGKHYERVFTNGVSTYQVLTRNLAAEGECAQSLPGRMREHGYTTSMYLGRRLVHVRGAFCFDRYFSGENASLLEGYALPSVLRAATSLHGASLRSKFLESRELVRTFENDAPPRSRPLFAYMHLLDMHAPYVPEALRQDAEYLSALDQFMSHCVAQGCDPSTPTSRAAIDTARRAYELTLADVEQRLEEMFALYRARGRAFRVIVTSDHGELFGEHGGFLHTGGLVPELLSVPFVVYDSTTSEGGIDCRLMTSSEALSDVVGMPAAEAQAARRERLTIDGSPLGEAVVDVAKERIEFEVRPEMDAHRGTPSNVHPTRRGTVPLGASPCAR